MVNLRHCYTKEGKPKAKLTPRQATQRQNWLYLTGERVSAYQCPICGHWHIGHKRGNTNHVGN